MKINNLVPEIYCRGSRDFEFISRLFEVIFNYVKTGSEIVNSNLDSDKVNPFLIELLCNTLGFTLKHKYITKDLVYIASAFSSLLKKKGTLESVEEAIVLLLNSQKINTPYVLTFNETTKELSIVLPPEMSDIILLEDLFDYILPAGITITLSTTSTYGNVDTKINVNDSLTYNWLSSSETGQIYNSNSPSSDKLQKGSLYETSSIYTATIASDEKNNINGEEVGEK